MVFYARATFVDFKKRGQVMLMSEICLPQFLDHFRWLSTFIGILIVFFAAWLMNAVVKRLLIKIIQRSLAPTSYGKDEKLTRFKVIPHLANVMPAMVVMGGVTLIPELPHSVVVIIKNM